MNAPLLLRDGSFRGGGVPGRDALAGLRCVVALARASRPLPGDVDAGRDLVVATTYPGGERVERAQVMLERHAVSSADGLCLACGVPGPCPERDAASAVFRLSLRLPRRVPGATRPELVGARRVGAVGMFTRT